MQMATKSQSVGSGELRLRGFSKTRKDELKNIAAFKGISLTAVTKELIIKALESTPEHMKQKRA